MSPNNQSYMLFFANVTFACPKNACFLLLKVTVAKAHDAFAKANGRAAETTFRTDV